MGIPARLGLVDVHDHLLSDSFKEMIGGINLFPFHGYTELFINGKWVRASPAYDLETCRRKRFILVEFDGVNDAKDSPCDQDGRPHIEHVNDHGSYEDLPWDEMRSYYKEWVAQLGLDWDELMQMGERVRHSKSYGDR